MASFQSALIHSFLGKYFGIALQFGTTLILSRLLTPEDYGLYTIAFVFVSLATVIREFGVPNYIIKEKDLTTQKVQSAFAILLMVAPGLALMLFVFAGFIAEFYQKTELKFMLQVLSVNMLVAPFGSITRALLERAMNFKPILIVNLGSQVAGVCTMIFLAMQGVGAMTLVWGSLVQAVSQALFFQFYRPKNLPLFPAFSQVREVFSYSKFVIASSIITHVGTYIGQLITGKFFSIESAGQLDRASSTVMLFNRFVTEGLMPVVTPYISRMSREAQDIKPKLKALTQIQLSLSWSFYAMLALCAEPVIIILFGAQWYESVQYLLLYCIGMIIFSTIQLTDPVFLGLGLAKPHMKIQLVLNCLSIALAFMLVKHGIYAVIISITILVPSIRLLITLFMMKKYISIEPLEFSKWCLMPMLTALAVSIPMGLFHLLLGGDWKGHMVVFGCVIVLSAIVWVAAIWNQVLGVKIREIVFNKTAR